ncbi:acyl-CoA dehydrogenase family protein [Nocardia sp. NBC_00565]|uniref:acyl-CoA dehydrogenase family protein n=1 Tax=Nocardia sp. NBC_00565 TaxID=2975993 RepID=UPI002E7FF9B2|nr:acyl-CoA dehydrogenase family protein [Nocardia sp. NBC_00565]WUC01936.1 acyl-CoA dehydrogenase family protein [Nocardia sp. NBC_00565]
MAWDFSDDTEFRPTLDWIREFVAHELIPLEPLADEVGETEWQQILEPLKQRVRDRGLWGCHLEKALGGQGFGQLRLAQMNLITGRCPFGQEVFGNMAPDSGNAELLAGGATDSQKDRWLWPNLRGEIRSAFAITEPWVAGTDPTQIESTAELDGDEWVLNGRKWMITNASSADFIIFMMVTDPSAPPHRRCSMFVVERGTAGMDIFRDIPSMHSPSVEYGRRGNHAEIILNNVRVPGENLIGEPGGGFVLSQVRLGPGRLHHATRWLGEAERAFDMLCERTVSRTSFGKSYARHQMVQQYVADSRIEIDAAKLLTLRAAWKFDAEGGQAARSDIAMVKVYNAKVVFDVVDRALQVHGSLGYSSDLPLESMFRIARMASMVDGANEVHKVTIARSELQRYHAVDGWPSEHIPTRLHLARQRFGHLLEATA